MRVGKNIKIYWVSTRQENRCLKLLVKLARSEKEKTGIMHYQKDFLWFSYNEDNGSRVTYVSTP